MCFKNDDASIVRQISTRSHTTNRRIQSQNNNFLDTSLVQKIIYFLTIISILMAVGAILCVIYHYFNASVVLMIGLTVACLTVGTINYLEYGKHKKLLR